MGFRPSPFYAVRFYYWAEEVAWGNPKKISNPLRWNEVILNLPGNPTYDPTLPRVMKWDKVINKLQEISWHLFVDDLRASGLAKEQCWQIERQVASPL
jgi:hypothetical protein